MANYKEIVTKAIIGKGKKTFSKDSKLDLELVPNTVLGCWVINHNFKGTFNLDTIVIEGSFDVNIWYSYDEDTKTNVISKNITYKEEVNVTVNIDAKIIRTEDFSYELDLGNGYKFNKEIYCNEQCNIDAVVEKGGILNNSIIYDPKRPTAEINKLKFKNITGYIYIK